MGAMQPKNTREHGLLSRVVQKHWPEEPHLHCAAPDSRVSHSPEEPGSLQEDRQLC